VSGSRKSNKKMGIVWDIAKLAALGLAARVLEGWEEELRKGEEKRNPHLICISCGTEYRLKDSGYMSFCDDECHERGALLECDYCHEEYFKNEGYDSDFCSSSCEGDYWDD